MPVVVHFVVNFDSCNARRDTCDQSKTCKQRQRTVVDCPILFIEKKSTNLLLITKLSETIKSVMHTVNRIQYIFIWFNFSSS